MQSNFRLVMRAGPSVGKSYPLDKNEMYIGRDLSNEIVINDPEVSRRHARLFSQGGSYVLEDLGSTNGSFVNGQRLMGPHLLRPGDMIIFGERMSLVYESSDFDQDATMVAPSSRPSYSSEGPAQIYNAPPAYEPPPPAYDPPPPAYQQQRNIPVDRSPVDSYAGQVPASYAPEAPPERRFPVVLVVVIAFLLLSCICLAVAAWNAPQWFWCMFPIWPEGYCP
jgi:predicted component of type VI protein secretion system